MAARPIEMLLSINTVGVVILSFLLGIIIYKNKCSNRELKETIENNAIELQNFSQNVSDCLDSFTNNIKEIEEEVEEIKCKIPDKDIQQDIMSLNFRLDKLIAKVEILKNSNDNQYQRPEPENYSELAGSMEGFDKDQSQLGFNMGSQPGTQRLRPCQSSVAYSELAGLMEELDRNQSQPGFNTGDRSRSRKLRPCQSSASFFNKKPLGK